MSKFFFTIHALVLGTVLVVYFAVVILLPFILLAYFGFTLIAIIPVSISVLFSANFLWELKKGEFTCDSSEYEDDYYDCDDDWH